MTDEKKESPARIWPWVLIGMIPLLYWLSAGPFMRWQTSARTRREYHARLKLEQQIYVPILWLEPHDPTHAIGKLDYWMIQPWENKGLNWATLSEE